MPEAKRSTAAHLRAMKVFFFKFFEHNHVLSLVSRSIFKTSAPFFIFIFNFCYGEAGSQAGRQAGRRIESATSGPETAIYILNKSNGVQG